MWELYVLVVYCSLRAVLTATTTWTTLTSLSASAGDEGLSVKLGNTEKVYLNNIIDVDETVKLDNSNFYYLVEDGETDFNVSVENVNAKFENTNIRTNQPVLTFDGVLEEMDQSQIPAGITEVPVGANQVFGGKAEEVMPMPTST